MNLTISIPLSEMEGHYQNDRRPMASFREHVILF